MGIADCIEQWASNSDCSFVSYWTYISNFIDWYNTQPSLYKIIVEPCFPDSTDNIIRCMTAAIVEYLAVTNKIHPPSWVNKKEYYLDEPYFRYKDGALKWITLVESPVSFAKRQIFVSKDIVSRC